MNYRKDSCVSRTQNFQVWFWEKKIPPKSTWLVKKVCRFFADVSNKLGEISISSDIYKLINFKNTFWKLLFNQCPYFLTTVIFISKAQLKENDRILNENKHRRMLKNVCLATTQSFNEGSLDARTFASAVRGYHVFQDLFKPSIREKLVA